MELLVIVGAAVGLLSLLVISSVVSGWVLSVLWGWFFVPILGLPPIGIVQAIGISLVVNYLTHHYQYHEDRKPSGEKLVSSIMFAVLYPLLALLIGWIAHMFMPAL